MIKEREKRQNSNQHFCTLKRYMARRHITQKALAIDSGIPLSSISRIARGIMWPDVYTALRIAKLLQVDVSDIWHIE